MSVGNLIFAGFYLLNGKSFEKTLSCVSELLDIDCEIYSATEGGGEFTLVAVLEDGEIIWTEAEIVEKRHNKQIIEIACVKTNLIPDLRWRERGISSASEKTQLIIENSIVPAISVGAKAAIEQADVIIYPPGTQFSSLLPSYLICRDAIKKSQARRKILFCNLECDNDIQNMVWKDILELVLKYSKDSNNEFSVTDICIDRKSVLNIGDERFFKNAYIHRDYFESKNKAGKHSGIMARLYINNIYYQTNDLPTYKFISTAPNGAYKQTALIENFIDNISKEQNEIVLQNITVINNDRLIHHIHNDIIINNINTWLKSPDSDYLIIFSFDGIYDAIDVLSLVSSLKNNMASVAVGNRFTSIKRLNHARKVVYNDVPLNKILSKIGGALVRMLFSKRTLTDLADPMTGLIVISRVEANRLSMVDEKFDTTTGFLMRVVEKGGAIVSQDINFLPLRGLRSQGKITQGLRILREIVLK